MLRILVYIAVVLVASSASAETGRFRCEGELAAKKQKGLLTKVESQYRAVKDVTAEFVQFSYFVGLSQGEQSKGTVAFKKPGKMDWQYSDPDEQRFVSDGTTLWHFQPEDNQVSLGDFRGAFNSELPVSFLLGVGKLSSTFSLKTACKTDGGILLKLSPKESDPSLREFELVVRSQDYTPIGAKVLDVGGNETRISLVNLSLNNELNDKQFAFKIPRGVDVLDYRETPTPTPQRRRPIIEDDDLF